MDERVDAIQVLHVDDDPDFTDVAATFIERATDRIDVETAVSADEGLDRLDGSVDCVISDYEMPGIDGIEFLQSVREEYPDLPFILFTGKGSEAVASEAISAGITDYLQKSGTTEQYELLCKRVENAVLKDRAQTNYRELFEKTPVGLTIHDPTTGEIIDANHAFGDLLGYTPSELEGEHPGDLAPDGSPFDREQADQLMESALETGSERFEWRDRTKDGDAIWVEVTLTRTTIDGRQRVLAVVQGITEDKTRKTTLERERERFRALFEALPEAVTHVVFEDGDPVVRDVNPAFEEVFGYDRSDVIGKSINEVVVPDEKRSEADMIDEKIQDGEVIRREIQRQTANGERHFLFTTAYVGGPDGDECFGIAFDITERKNSEQALERQNEQLEAFTSVVSHDLRNPLSVAEGHLELARNEHESEHLDAVNSAHERMRELIEDLLSIAQTDEMETETEPIEVTEVAENCWRNVVTANATLVVDTERTIEAEPSYFQQLLENLIRNATEHGGSAVTVTIGDTDGGFFVADDGSGIPPDDRDNLFEMGYSGSENTTGIGLSIVERVVDRHGWDVTVTESELGGARFEITGVEIV